MDYIDNIELITRLVKSGFFGIVGIFFIGLAIWIKKNEDRWNFKNIGIGLLAGGVTLLLISVSMVMDSLQDGGVIAIDRNNPVWLIMDVIKVLACVLIFAIAGFAMRSKRIKENDMYDMEISGKIIGYDTLTGRTKLPGYAQPTVEYIDPYSGEPDSYMVNQDINRKKHPIGSEYKLLYSREKRTAYEKKSNKVYREMEVCFGGLAVLIFWLVFHTCGSFFNKRRGGHAI
mgnify:FL=1